MKKLNGRQMGHLVQLDSILSDLYGSEYNQFKIVRQSDY